jgi:hypothetical protein
MKKLLFGLALAVAGLALADTTVTQVRSTAKSKLTLVIIQPLPDGGCAAQAQGEVWLADGGEALATTPTKVVELTGASRADCLSFINRANTLWRAQEGVQ